MKANFINFLCAESEFIVKNQFYNRTSELGYIWHIFGKLGYFWLFLENPDIQVTVNITVNKDQFICRRLVVASADVLEKRQIFQKMCQMPPIHTAGSDTIFVQIYMDPPPGVPGVSKNQNFFFTNKTDEFLR